MSHLLVIFLAGVAGSLHCVGMCGGFACALGADRRGGLATLARHLIYNLGRVTSYCFLGVCAGSVGLFLVDHGGESGWGNLAQRALAVLSGFLMLYVGLQFLGFQRGLGPSLPGVGWLAVGLRQVIQSPSPGAPLALGVLNGLLPCPLVYAFVAHAAGGGAPLQGLMIMAAFGLGTFPAMLLMGGVGWWARAQGAASAGGLPQVLSGPAGGRILHSQWRQEGVRIAGVLILLLGVITVARGVLPVGAHLHGLGMPL
ncbi:MAG: sulfite exporter TauE/SafE family protein [Chromatiaceae bacterium]